MQTIMRQLLYSIAAGTDTVLVTIAAQTGSAPRGVGSQMLVGPQGRLCGTIGGGRVELCSEETAMELLTRHSSALRHFGLDLTQSPDSLSMACGGAVTVLFQFIPGGDALWQRLAETVLARLEHARPGWLVLRAEGSAPALLDEQGTPLVGAFASAHLPIRPAVLTDGVLCLPLPVGERVVIFGAGHIARALVSLLRTVNFRPVVFDDRPNYADAAAFPAAEAVICGDFRNIEASLPLFAGDYTAVMTSGHLHDLEVEAQLLQRELAYVGVIGSRSKIAVVSQRLRELGISEEAIASVHTPIGTAIRAETPEEIAVSIAGELIYVRAIRRDAAGQKGV